LPEGPESAAEWYVVGRPFVAHLSGMAEYVAASEAAREAAWAYAWEAERSFHMQDWRSHSSRMNADEYNRETPLHHMAESRVRARRLRAGRAKLGLGQEPRARERGLELTG